jgi:hypothetical protein
MSKEQFHDVWAAGLEEELNKLPYTKHLDDGQYNDGQMAGFELGATWGYDKAKETLYTKKDLLIAFRAGNAFLNNSDLDFKEAFENCVQSLKQPTND